MYTHVSEVLVLLLLHLLYVNRMIVMVLAVVAVMRLLRRTRSDVLFAGRYRAPLQTETQRHARLRIRLHFRYVRSVRRVYARTYRVSAARTVGKIILFPLHVWCVYIYRAVDKRDTYVEVDGKRVYC